VGIFTPVSEQHMNAEILYDDPFVVAAGAQNPWCRRRRIRLADLMNEPWTLPPPDSLTGRSSWRLFAPVGSIFPARRSSPLPYQHATPYLRAAASSLWFPLQC
jgi:DNA-binding transcriptional LysR family regulator